jgi:hypothetical protein
LEAVADERMRHEPPLDCKGWFWHVDFRIAKVRVQDCKWWLFSA